MQNTIVAAVSPAQHTLLEYASDATGIPKAELVRRLIDRHLEDLIRLERDGP